MKLLTINVSIVIDYYTYVGISDVLKRIICKLSERHDGLETLKKVNCGSVSPSYIFNGGNL